MKKIAILWIMGAVALMASQSFAQVQKHNYKNERLCKLFQQKALTYQKHMRNDDYAKATLASYKKRAKMFCGN